MRSIGAWRCTYQPFCSRSGAELVVGQLAGEVALELVAELRRARVHELAVEVGVLVHLGGDRDVRISGDSRQRLYIWEQQSSLLLIPKRQ